MKLFLFCLFSYKVVIAFDMFYLMLFFLKLLFRKKYNKDTDYMLKISVLEKEVQILKRRLELQNKRVLFKGIERYIFVLVSLLSKSKDLFSIVKPETILKWYHTLIRKRWTFKKGNKRVGRPKIPIVVKYLVLKMKNSNVLWGSQKIADELGKVDTILSHESVRKIISVFRKQGKVKKSLTWSTFLESHWNSLFAMDSFTVDSITGKHFSVLVFLELKTRKIIQFAITEHPVREFIRQQIIEFTNNIPGTKYLIHDRAPEFCCFDYSEYNIVPKKTPIKSPNLNAYVERVIGTIQREALDWFIIFNRNQLYRIIKEYVNYYNHCRHHQGIDMIPDNLTPKNKGSVVSEPILGGLHNHYYRLAS